MKQNKGFIYYRYIPYFLFSLIALGWSINTNRILCMILCMILVIDATFRMDVNLTNWIKKQIYK